MVENKVLQGKEILIAATGGIAVYKTAVLTSRLVQSGAGVTVIMTDSATRLVGPQTFESLTGRPVRLSLWDGKTAHPHIELARSAELLCVVPATANIMAKAAMGLADDLVSTVLLAFDGPVLMAPAMNAVMWKKPSVQRNVRQLTEDGMILVGPDSGHLSCGESGPGRMVDPEVLFKEIVRLLS